MKLKRIEREKNYNNLINIQKKNDFILLWIDVDRCVNRQTDKD